MNASKLGRYSSQAVNYWLHRGTRGRLAPHKHYTIVYRTGVVRLTVSMPNWVPSSKAEKALSKLQLYTSPDGNAEERSAIVNLAKRALSPLKGRVSDVSFTLHPTGYPYFTGTDNKPRKLAGVVDHPQLNLYDETIVGVVPLEYSVLEEWGAGNSLEIFLRTLQSTRTRGIV